MALRSATYRALLLTIATIALSREVRAFDDDKPSPQAVEALKAKRHRELKEIEEETESMRTRIMEQLTDPLAYQNGVIDRAEEEYRKSKLATEIAKCVVREYEQGFLLQEIARARGKAALADDDLGRSVDKLGEIQLARQKGKNVSNYYLQVYELNQQRCLFEKEQAETELEVLVRYAGPREVKRLASLAEAAKEVEKSKQELLDVERNKGDRLEEQLKRLKVRSPEDYIIGLINDAVHCEEQVIELSRGALTIEGQIREKSAEGQALLDQLKGKQQQATTLMDRAKAQLIEAAAFGVMIRSQRGKLAEAETRLKDERAKVEAADRVFAPA